MTSQEIQLIGSALHNLRLAQTDVKRLFGRVALNEVSKASAAIALAQNALKSILPEEPLSRSCRNTERGANR